MEGQNKFLTKAIAALIHFERERYMDTNKKMEEQAVNTEKATMIVDLDANPFVPKVWKLRPEDQLPNRVTGQFAFDPTKVAMYLDKEQKNGNVIVGHKLRKKLKSQPVYGANLLDFYLKNPHLIPEEWKGRQVYFWGTIYRAGSSLVVRSLAWYRVEGWVEDFGFLVDRFDGEDPAVISISSRLDFS